MFTALTSVFVLCLFAGVQETVRLYIHCAKPAHPPAHTCPERIPAKDNMDSYCIWPEDSDEEVKDVPGAANQNRVTKVAGASSQKKKRRSPIKSKPIGFVCINKMMNKVIGKVLTKARARDNIAAKRRSNPEFYKEYNRKALAKFYANNKSKANSWSRAYNIKHKDTLRSKDRVRRKQRLRDNPIYAAAQRMRGRLRSVFDRHGIKKRDRTLAYIGCSANQIVEQMNLQCDLEGRNKHSNVMDHIFPFRCYDLSNHQEWYKVANFTNIQPLSHEENQWKYEKLPTKAMAAKVDRDKWPPGITEDMLPDIYPGWATPLRMHAEPTPGASSSTDTTSVVDESMSSSESDSECSNDSDDSDSD
jgi:hypothetical protein